MIRINLNTARFKLTVEGHAQPEESEDYKAICTGVSALAQALGYTISKCEKDHEAITEFEMRSDPGDFLLKVKPSDWAEAMIRKKFRDYGDGLEMIATCNPEAVQMIWDGENVQPFEGGLFSE